MKEQDSLQGNDLPDSPSCKDSQNVVRETKPAGVNTGCSGEGGDGGSEKKKSPDDKDNDELEELEETTTSSSSHNFITSVPDLVRPSTSEIATSPSFHVIKTGPLHKDDYREKVIFDKAADVPPTLIPESDEEESLHSSEDERNEDDKPVYSSSSLDAASIIPNLDDISLPPQLIHAGQRTQLQGSLTGVLSLQTKDGQIKVLQRSSESSSSNSNSRPSNGESNKKSSKQPYFSQSIPHSGGKKTKKKESRPGRRISSDILAEISIASQSSLSRRIKEPILKKLELSQEVLSQEDMFKGEKHEKDSIPPCTPAETIGSLQLSGNVTFAPESLDEDEENVVAPSQDAYGSVPLIIPASPTEFLSSQDEDEKNVKTSMKESQESKMAEKTPSPQWQSLPLLSMATFDNTVSQTRPLSAQSDKASSLTPTGVSTLPKNEAKNVESHLIKAGSHHRSNKSPKNSQVKTQEKLFLKDQILRLPDKSPSSKRTICEQDEAIDLSLTSFHQRYSQILSSHEKHFENRQIICSPKIKPSSLEHSRTTTPTFQVRLSQCKESPTKLQNLSQERMSKNSSPIPETYLNKIITSSQEKNLERYHEFQRSQELYHSLEKSIEFSRAHAIKREQELKRSQEKHSSEHQKSHGLPKLAEGQKFQDLQKTPDLEFNKSQDSQKRSILHSPWKNNRPHHDQATDLSRTSLQKSHETLTRLLESPSSSSATRGEIEFQRELLLQELHHQSLQEQCVLDKREFGNMFSLEHRLKNLVQRRSSPSLPDNGNPQLNIGAQLSPTIIKSPSPHTSQKDTTLSDQLSWSFDMSPSKRSKNEKYLLKSQDGLQMIRTMKKLQASQKSLSSQNQEILKDEENNFSLQTKIVSSQPHYQDKNFLISSQSRIIGEKEWESISDGRLLSQKLCKIKKSQEIRPGEKLARISSQLTQKLSQKDLSKTDVEKRYPESSVNPYILSQREEMEFIRLSSEISSQRAIEKEKSSVEMIEFPYQYVDSKMSQKGDSSSSESSLSNNSKNNFACRISPSSSKFSKQIVENSPKKLLSKLKIERRHLSPLKKDGNDLFEVDEEIQFSLPKNNTQESTQEIPQSLKHTSPNTLNVDSAQKIVESSPTKSSVDGVHVIKKSQEIGKLNSSALLSTSEDDKWVLHLSPSQHTETQYTCTDDDSRHASKTSVDDTEKLVDMTQEIISDPNPKDGLTGRQSAQSLLAFQLSIPKKHLHPVSVVTPPLEEVESKTSSSDSNGQLKKHSEPPQLEVATVPSLNIESIGSQAFDDSSMPVFNLERPTLSVAVTESESIQEPVESTETKDISMKTPIEKRKSTIEIESSGSEEIFSIAPLTKKKFTPKKRRLQYETDNDFVIPKSVQEISEQNSSFLKPITRRRSKPVEEAASTDISPFQDSVSPKSRSKKVSSKKRSGSSHSEGISKDDNFIPNQTTPNSSDGLSTVLSVSPKKKKSKRSHGMECLRSSTPKFTRIKQPGISPDFKTDKNENFQGSQEGQDQKTPSDISSVDFTTKKHEESDTAPISVTPVTSFGDKRENNQANLWKSKNDDSSHPIKIVRHIVTTVTKTVHRLITDQFIFQDKIIETKVYEETDEPEIIVREEDHTSPSISRGSSSLTSGSLADVSSISKSISGSSLNRTQSIANSPMQRSIASSSSSNLDKMATKMSPPVKPPLKEYPIRSDSRKSSKAGSKSMEKSSSSSLSSRRSLDPSDASSLPQSEILFPSPDEEAIPEKSPDKKLTMVLSVISPSTSHVPESSPLKHPKRRGRPPRSSSTPNKKTPKLKKYKSFSIAPNTTPITIPGENEPCKTSEGTAIKSSEEETPEQKRPLRIRLVSAEKNSKSKRRKYYLGVDSTETEETEEDVRLPISEISPHTPVNKPKEICPEDEISAVSPNDDPEEHLLPEGTKVMARWRDGYYYSGTVVAEEKSESVATTIELESARIMYCIQFDDGDKRIVKDSDLIVRDRLNVGQSVLAQSQDGYFDPGIVIGHYLDENEVGYIVEKDDGVSQRFARKNVILSTDQAASIIDSYIGVNTSTSSLSAISLDNIVDGRRRKPTSAGFYWAGESGKERTPKRRVEGQTPGGNTPTPKKGKRGAISTDAISNNDSPARSSPIRTLPSARVELTDLGPIPALGSTLFKGYTFLLTQAEKKDKPEKPLEEAPLSTESSGTEEEQFLIPFNKAHIRQQIEAGGGTVLKKFSQTQMYAGNLCFLIADTCCRTAKYFQSLAAGVSCISHYWIRDSCLSNHVQDHNHYILPAGRGLEMDTIIEWHGKNDSFKNMHIMLVSTHKDFRELWTPVLLAAQCEMVSRLPTHTNVISGTHLYVNVIVADDSCPTTILTRADQLQIPVVSIEWVIQSLIHGHLMDFNGHPKYHYNFKE